MRSPHALVLVLLAAGCQVTLASDRPAEPPSAVQAPSTPEPPPTAATEPSLDADEDNLRRDLGFLAADEQQGRPPGTEADERVQAYIEEQMQAAGLQPAFGSSYRQPFEVTDGVRATGRSELKVGTAAIEHALVPFASRSADAVTARLVFVGYGLAPDGKGSGSYAGIEDQVKGAIVVALGGAPPDDPHSSPAVTRPQSKLIAARDHGAVGFVLWEPDQKVAYPNHGEANDLRLPALWVGEAGTVALLSAFGTKPKKGANAERARQMKVGLRSRDRASLRSPVEPVTLRTANVAGVLPGQPGTRALVIGAHMDHLGEGTSHSLAPGIKEIHNGADDNASGVAVILEMARVLGALPPQQRPYSIHFVAFGAEEMGLLGSKHYVEHLPADTRASLVAMLNFDMVGRLGQEQGLVVAGTGTSSVWPRLLEEARGSLQIRASEDGYGASDQTSFYEAGLPVLHFFTGTHGDYHKPSDDADKINFAGAAAVAEVALRVAYAVTSEGMEPDYIKVARKAPARGGFRVSLGTIPDYGAQVDGVRLTGAREGGAAARAGLRSGDVITKIGEREIHNLDDLMATFAVLEPGTAVDVVVERDGQPLTLSVTPDAPQRR